MCGGVGDVPAFSVGGDVSGLAGPSVAVEGVGGEGAEVGCPGWEVFGGVVAEFVDAGGDSVCVVSEPAVEFVALLVGGVGRWVRG